MLALFQNLAHAQAAGELAARLGIKLRAEAGESLQLLELRIHQAQVARHGAEGGQLHLAAHTADRSADIDGG